MHDGWAGRLSALGGREAQLAQPALFFKRSRSDVSQESKREVSMHAFRTDNLHIAKWQHYYYFLPTCLSSHSLLITYQRLARTQLGRATFLVRRCGRRRSCSALAGWRTLSHFWKRRRRRILIGTRRCCNFCWYAI